MIKFLEGQTYYAVPYTSYFSDVFEAGPYNKLILQRIDECPVGPVFADVRVETSNNPAAQNWISVGGDLPSGVSTRSGLAEFVRVKVEMQATANAWLVSTVYALGNLADAANEVWECILAHTSSVDDEPEGVSGAAANWSDATVYTVADLVQVSGNGIVFYCIQSHTSSPADEPGVGANWQNYWMLNYVRYWTGYAGLLYTKISVYGKLVAD